MIPVKVRNTNREITLEKFEIWYMKPSFFRDGIMGMKWLIKQNLIPVESRLDQTHTKVCDVSIPDGSMEEAFASQQAERWSPNGEARELIESLGLRHTSMSVGDVLVRTAANGQRIAHMVDRFGFVAIL